MGGLVIDSIGFWGWGVFGVTFVGMFVCTTRMDIRGSLVSLIRRWFKCLPSSYLQEGAMDVLNSK